MAYYSLGPAYTNTEKPLQRMSVGSNSYQGSVSRTHLHKGQSPPPVWRIPKLYMLNFEQRTKLREWVSLKTPSTQRANLRRQKKQQTNSSAVNYPIDLVKTTRLKWLGILPTKLIASVSSTPDLKGSSTQKLLSLPREIARRYQYPNQLGIFFNGKLTKSGTRWQQTEGQWDKTP